MADLYETPAELNLYIGRGGSFTRLLIWYTDKTKTTRKNLTGYTFAGKVEEADGSTTDIAFTDTNLAQGEVTMSLTLAQMNAIGLGTHHWYKAWTVGGESRRVVAGKFTVLDYP